ncbi:MAG: hypothetical protein IKL04_07440 [Lachnospiraceae bacterium]|nr:hypothetical protein [Lachnospiraceae bacterium]
MDISTQKRILQDFVNIAPYIPLFIDEPVSVAVTNTETFIYNQPCKEIPVDCHIGEPFPPGSTPGMVMQSMERTRRPVPAHVYGVPFMSYAIPIWEDRKVVGCLMIAKSIEKINSVKDAISTLADEISQVSDAVGNITAEIQTVSENNQEIYGLMTRLLDETAKMNSILGVINKLSNSSKMLGLNASIEAARAGVAGKGFAVVAKEIERMSNDTTHSAKEISTMLSGVDKQVNDVSGKSRETADSVSQQAAALQEIAATMENLSTNVKVIEAYIQKL